MSAERKYVLIAIALQLVAAIGIGVLIIVATGDIWRGLEATGQIIGGATLLMLALWAVGRASGHH